MASPLSEFWMWLLGGVASLGLPAGTVVKNNHQRSKRNQQRLEGDPENPSDEGLMDIAHDTREKVDRLETRMEHEHREVMSKLEEISDGGFEAAGGD